MLSTKSRSITKLGLVVLIAISVIALSILPACAPAKPAPTKPGEEKVIKVGVFYDLTGPAAGWGNLMNKGAISWFELFNEEGGFGDGIMVEPVWVDTTYKADVFKGHYEKVKADERVMTIITAEGASNEALRPTYDRDHFPVVTSYISPMMVFPPGYLFGGTWFSAEGVLGELEWFSENMKDIVGEKPPVKIAYLGAELGFVRSTVAILQKFAPEIGVELVADEKIPYAASDCTPNIMRARDSGAHVMCVEASPTQVGRVFQDAKKLGVYPDMVFFCGHNYCNRSTAQLFGEEGIGVWSATAMGTYNKDKKKDAPGALKMGEKWEELYGTPAYENWDMSGAAAAGDAAVALEGIKRALKEVGYENLKGATGREAVYQGLISLKDFKSGGLFAPMTFGENNRIGVREMMMVRLVGPSSEIPEVHWEGVSDFFDMPIKLTADDIPAVE